MLLGENLCRNHDCALPAVFKCHDHGQKSENRLSASDIALNQPFHQPVRCKILLQFVPHPLLSAGETIWKAVDDFLCLPHGLHRKMVDSVAIPVLHTGDSQKKEKELIEAETVSG